MEPDGRLTVFTLGFPKSGTTWLARLLGDVLDSPVGATVPRADKKCIAHEGLGRQGKYHIRQGHSTPVNIAVGPLVPRMGDFAWRMVRDEKLIIMVRDPRDLVLSVAHHWALSYSQAITCMDKGEWPVVHGGGLVKWVRAWQAVPLPYVKTSYEMLSADPEAETHRILAVMGVEPVVDVGQAVTRQSFANRKAMAETYGDSMPYGKEFQKRFLRRGQPGAWRDELPRTLWPRVESCFGELMRLLGYTTGPEWMNE